MSTIITKNSANSGSTPSSLVQGELAVNVTDGRLFYGSGSGNVVKEFGVTASFVTASNVYGPYGSNSVISASYAGTASNALNAQDVLIYVLNQSGQNIAKGVVVHITASGNSSDTPRIITASYENDNNSANTLGITNQAIADGDLGYVMTEGVLKGIDTSNFQSGQLIYLGATGSIIGYAPQAPLHSVRLGQVVRQQSNNGSIYVRIDNGYELEELHDVYIMTASLQYGDLLMRSGSVWTNTKQLSGSYSITGSLTVSGSSTFTNIGPAIFSGSVTGINGFTGSLFGTASYALNSAGGTLFPYTGSAGITGSLTVTGSIYTDSTIYSPFIISINFETLTSYTYKAPYAFKINSVESDPSGSITLSYVPSGSVSSSNYVFGSTINKFDSLTVIPLTSSLVILNSVRI